MRVPLKWLNEFVQPEVDAAELPDDARRRQLQDEFRSAGADAVFRPGAEPLLVVRRGGRVVRTLIVETPATAAGPDACEVRFAPSETVVSLTRPRKSAIQP